MHFREHVIKALESYVEDLKAEVRELRETVRVSKIYIVELKRQISYLNITLRLASTTPLTNRVTTVVSADKSLVEQNDLIRTKNKRLVEVVDSQEREISRLQNLNKNLESEIRVLKHRAGLLTRS